MNATLPLQAEAKAVKWALNLTFKLEAEFFYLESNSNICVDAMSSHILGIPWRIKSICTYLSHYMSQNPNVSLLDELLEKQIVQQMPWPSGPWKRMYLVILI